MTAQRTAHCPWLKVLPSAHPFRCKSFAWHRTREALRSRSILESVPSRAIGSPCWSRTMACGRIALNGRRQRSSRFRTSALRLHAHAVSAPSMKKRGFTGGIPTNLSRSLMIRRLPRSQNTCWPAVQRLFASCCAVSSCSQIVRTCSISRCGTTWADTIQRSEHARTWRLHWKLLHVQTLQLSTAPVIAHRLHPASLNHRDPAVAALKANLIQLKCAQRYPHLAPEEWRTVYWRLRLTILGELWRTGAIAA